MRPVLVFSLLLTERPTLRRPILALLAPLLQRHVRTRPPTFSAVLTLHYTGWAQANVIAGFIVFICALTTFLKDRHLFLHVSLGIVVPILYVRYAMC